MLKTVRSELGPKRAALGPKRAAPGKGKKRRAGGVATRKNKRQRTIFD
jgi:hypothetical protein